MKVKSEEFDTLFDEGEEVIQALDLSKAKRPMQKTRRVNVDFPEWMVASLDREARRLGVTRQAIIKIWLADRLEKGAMHKP